MKEGKIVKVSGPLVVARGIPDIKMYDVVRVGEKNLVGEVIELHGDEASIQVYEETSGIGPGEPVRSTGQPLTVELGPGLIQSIFDGIQRPLDVIRNLVGDYIPRGVEVPGLDRKRKWEFSPTRKEGDKVVPGDIIGEVQETSVIVHKVMVPEGVEGVIKKIHKGKFTVEEPVAEVEVGGKTVPVTMSQKWPVRRGRTYKRKLAPHIPLITGQRVIDAFFPIGKGGSACVPGPFGSGKTIIQHQLAKWVDAQIIIFIGCGERGNEMTSVLMEFPHLKDPHTGEPLLKRSVLIANTSNMPVAAREASIYTGITIGEYYRDMGYSVAVMADSTSRWAEALREISGRLEEMPGEEGYPAYLPARIAEFYERAGEVVCQGNDQRVGALTVIGSVSPPGGDLTDPVVQATLKVVKVFWSLEDWLAYRRHFPAINWLTSYSLYVEDTKEFYIEKVGEDWASLRQESMRILQEESELQEIVRLVGIESLSPKDRLTLETARSLREDFLHQNAFHEIDTYTSLPKQARMLRTILTLHKACQKALDRGVSIETLINLEIREKVARMRFIKEEDEESFDELMKEIKEIEEKEITEEVGGSNA